MLLYLIQDYDRRIIIGVCVCVCVFDPCSLLIVEQNGAKIGSIRSMAEASGRCVASQRVTTAFSVSSVDAGCRMERSNGNEECPRS